MSNSKAEPGAKPGRGSGPDAAAPPQTDSAVPPQTDSAVPPHTDSAVPPQTDSAAPPKTDSAVPPSADAAMNSEEKPKGTENVLTIPNFDVELVDVGGGNVGSVMRCLERLGIRYKQVQTPDQLTGNAPLVLPGVGSFGAVMQFLRGKNLADPVSSLVRQGTPLLGICVGLQVLFSDSEESPGIDGLNLLPGKVVKFRRGKVPQIGWNLITPTPQAKSLFPNEEYVYFVNSYYPRPDQEEVISFTADYYETFCAAVHHKNITAFQFHPEKSGKAGERLIMRWLNEVKSKCQ